MMRPLPGGQRVLTEIGSVWDSMCEPDRWLAAACALHAAGDAAADAQDVALCQMDGLACALVGSRVRHDGIVLIAAHADAQNCTFVFRHPSDEEAAWLVDRGMRSGSA